MNAKKYKVISERMPDGSINYNVSFNLKSEDDIFWFDREIENVIIKESDGRNYYIHMGLFFIKVPYEYVLKNNDEPDKDIWKKTELAIIKYILHEYYDNNHSFRLFLRQKNYDIKKIRKIFKSNAFDDDIDDDIIESFCHYYYDITDYFDTWALVDTDDTYSEINNIILRKKSDNHVETVNW